MDGNVEIHVEERFVNGTVAFFAKWENQQSASPCRRFARAVEFVEVTEGYRPETMLELSPTEAKALATKLWRLGYSPEDAKDTSGEVVALRAHIATLERIIFEKAKGLG